MNDRLSFEVLRELYPPFSDTRPVPRPGQITDISEIRPGRKFAAVNLRLRSSEILEVLEIPSSDDMGQLWVKVNRQNRFVGKLEGRISLADHGLIPYTDGRWNTTILLVEPRYAKQLVLRRRAR